MSSYVSNFCSYQIQLYRLYDVINVVNVTCTMCRNLGYKVSSDGKVEEQDKFIHRVRGFTRLYASLIISSPPPSAGMTPQSVHPHGIEHAWCWLAHMVNIEPRPDVTATVLHEFLLVAGHSLWIIYRRQFVKLMEAVSTNYLPHIVAVTPAGCTGPVTRLESVLKLCITGTISPPQGLLTASFWHT